MVTTYLRYKHLKARGIVNSWPSLRYKIEHNGFPVGCYLGPNTRAWTADEVQEWLDALPTVNPRKTAASSQEVA